MLIAVGFVVAFLSALVVVKTLVGFVSRNGFAPFAYYRIVVGLVMAGDPFLSVSNRARAASPAGRRA